MRFFTTFSKNHTQFLQLFPIFRPCFYNFFCFRVQRYGVYFSCIFNFTNAFCLAPLETRPATLARQCAEGWSKHINALTHFLSLIRYIEPNPSPSAGISALDDWGGRGISDAQTSPVKQVQDGYPQSSVGA